MIDYDGTYAVWGPPGTGKTTFLTKQLGHIAEKFDVLRREPPVAVVSMTRTAAAVIASRNQNIPAHRIGTIHALIYRMLDRPDLAETKLAEWNKDHPHLQIDSGLSADEDDPTQDFMPGPRRDTGTDLYAAYALARAQLAPMDKLPRDVAFFAAKWQDWKKEEHLLDFADLIDAALHDLSGAPFKSELIIGDEQQDQSAAESAVIEKWGAAAGAVIRAGDPWQALYTWRGANPGAFFDKSLPFERRRVLKQSHRVPARVHALAIKWARHLSDFEPIEYLPTPERGDAYFFPAATWRRPEPVIAAAQRKIAEGEDVMICSPCGYQLTPTIAALRKRGIPFSNPWRMRQGAWNPLAKRRGVRMVDRIADFLRPDDATWGEARRAWNVRELESWSSICRAKGLFEHGGKTAIQTLLESDPDARVEDDALMRLLDPDSAGELLKLLFHADVSVDRPSLRNAHGDATANLLSFLESRISPAHARRAAYAIAVARNTAPAALREPPMLFVGTIHSFKGAEADHVFIVPDLSTEGTRSLHSGALRDDVVRMFYVAITRARKSVTFLRPADRHGAIPFAGLPLEVANIDKFSA